MREYKGYSHNERMANLNKVKKAIKDNLIPDPKDCACEICGQTEGVREYHCYNYHPLVAMKCMMVLCWKCHRNLHILEIGETHERYGYVTYYFDEVNKGKVFPPMYTKYYTKEMEEERRKQRENGADAN